MQIFNDITTKAGLVPKLRLFTKEEGKAPVSTGRHMVRILEAGKGAVEIENKRTHQKELFIWVYFEEKRQKVRYPIPVKNKEGGVHYLVERFAGLEEGDEITIEGINKDGRSFVSIDKVKTEFPVESQEDNILTINEDDNLSEDTGE